MEAQARQVAFYVDLTGKAHAQEWLDGLRNAEGRAAVKMRLLRAQRGLLGDCERYGQVTELKIHHGPGYRVYGVEDGPVLVVLLCGGDKSTQQKDFKKARRLAHEYQEEKSRGTIQLRRLP